MFSTYQQENLTTDGATCTMPSSFIYFASVFLTMTQFLLSSQLSIVYVFHSKFDFLKGTSTKLRLTFLLKITRNIPRKRGKWIRS